jgi:uncharacterized protein YdcH (DUF465 family)
MTHTPHDLAAEFPEAAERMHSLRAENPHFARLADAYHEVNRAIHRAETRIEPISDEAEGDLRRQRMRLKDEIAALLRA